MDTASLMTSEKKVAAMGEKAMLSLCSAVRMISPAEEMATEQRATSATFCHTGITYFACCCDSGEASGVATFFAAFMGLQ